VPLGDPTDDETPALESLDIVDHHRYASGYPHEDWRRLRNEAPVCPMRIPGWEPFWALSTPGPIRDVCSRPEQFLNAPTLHVLAVDHQPGPSFRSIINMDPPDHGRYRRLVSAHMTRRWVRSWEPRLEEIAHGLLDATWTSRPRAACEFVADVAEWYPFHVIAEVLGIPESDHRLVLDLMNRNLLGSLPELMDYMGALARDRRQNPGDDLGSVLATAEIDGQPLAEHELVAYYCSLVAAAHGTVRNTLAGALLAFAEFPDQLQALREHPELIDSAVEEVLRWATPIVSFTRTAATDTEVAGHTIAAGDRLALFYASANRDEPTFGDPFEFRVDREPNHHLELSVFLRAVADRIEDLEVTGPITRYRSSLLSGVEHLPLRYRLAPRP